MDTGFITVIIHTYKRAPYIKDAITSILNQNFDKDKYEIILTSGFKFNEDDELLKNNKIRTIYIDSKNNGVRWIEAIREARGELICFLDDDDAFSPIKLKSINEIYKKTKFDYYHNAFTFNINHLSNEIGDNYILIRNNKVKNSIYKLLKYNIKYKLAINSSSICVKKDVIIKYIAESNAVTMGWDVYLFYLYLSHSNIFVIDNNILTYYRQHQSYSHALPDKAEFIRSEIIRDNDAKDAYRLYINIVSQNFLKRLLKYEAFSYEIAGYICDSPLYKSLKTKDLFLFIVFSKTYSIKFRLFYFFLGLSSKISKKLAFHFYYRFTLKL